MFLRKLTDKEIEQIKKAKDTANKIIKNYRKRFTEEIKLYTKSGHVTKVNLLIKQLNGLNVITGLPVIINVEDMFLRVNYELLKKFDRLLDKSDFSLYQLRIEGKSLIIRYGKHGQNGAIELYELPTQQTELLTELPVISLTA